MHVAAPLQVWVRSTRPPASKDHKLSEWQLDTKRTVSLDGQTYRFSRLFDHDSLTGQIFQAWRSDLEAVRDNRHLLIFAYGHSGSGKSSTLTKGVPTEHGVKQQSLIKLMIGFIFAGMSRLCCDFSTTDRRLTVQQAGYEAGDNPLHAHERITASVMGIHCYRGQLQQLTARTGEDNNTIPLEWHKSIGMIPGYLTVEMTHSYPEPVECSTVEAVMDVVKAMEKNRKSGKESNKDSSRSHAWFEIRFSKAQEDMGAITFFDLAGHEEQPKIDSKHESKGILEALGRLREGPFKALASGSSWSPANDENLASDHTRSNKPWAYDLPVRPSDQRSNHRSWWVPKIQTTVFLCIGARRRHRRSVERL